MTTTLKLAAALILYPALLSRALISPPVLISSGFAALLAERLCLSDHLATPSRLCRQGGASRTLGALTESLRLSATVAAKPQQSMTFSIATAANAQFLHWPTTQRTTARYSFHLPQPAAPPAQDTDPLSPTHTGSANEFVSVLSCCL